MLDWAAADGAVLATTGIAWTSVPMLVLGGCGWRDELTFVASAKNFMLIEREHRRFVQQLSRQSAGPVYNVLLIRRISMKTSARNQFLGKVMEVQRGAVNDEVTLEIAGGNKIIAVITHESTDDLGLRPGVQALAIIKASSIIVMVDDGLAKFSARNQLVGTVKMVHDGIVNSEVIIDLDGGGTLAAIITRASCESLGLAERQRATGMFKASSVILGVSA